VSATAGRATNAIVRPFGEIALSVELNVLKDVPVPGCVSPGSAVRFLGIRNRSSSGAGGPLKNP
jgi:hypothetical protein